MMSLGSFVLPFDGAQGDKGLPTCVPKQSFSWSFPSDLPIDFLSRAHWIIEVNMKTFQSFTSDCFTR